MTFDEFKKYNNEKKRSYGARYKIARVQLTKGICTALLYSNTDSSPDSVIARVDDIIARVINTRFSVSNPSILKNWPGFDK